ncbi:MAG TPA: hypothetical protein VG675_16085 [Bryobacteraceae bacterium]|nr:hypothetical protein [Bryobacteraceae bacterium]
MCDYSLQGLPNRLAVAGEQLSTYRFPTGSIGMASPFDIAASKRPKAPDGQHRGWWAALKCWFNAEMELSKIPAVCIPPGARLRMSDVPERMRRDHSLHPVEEVTFDHLSEAAYRYRDAIRFDNGCREVLQAFAEGVSFVVLSLGDAEMEPEPHVRVIVHPFEAA